MLKVKLVLIFFIIVSGCTSVNKPNTVITADGKVVKNVPICQDDKREDCLYVPKSKAACLKSINPEFKAFCDNYK